MGNCRSKQQDNVDCFSNQQHQDTSQINGTSTAVIANDDHSTESPLKAKHIVSLFGFNRNDANITERQQTERQLNRTANEVVIDSTRAEVSDLLKRIHQFEGTSSDDKNYKYLDEMLTRCILKLDQVECNNMEDRNTRKEAIQGVNEAIAILERKLAINSDIKEVQINLK